MAESASIWIVDRSTMHGGSARSLAELLPLLQRRKPRHALIADCPRAHHEEFGAARELLRFRYPSSRWWMAGHHERPLRGLHQLDLRLQGRRLGRMMQDHSPDLVHFNTVMRRTRFDLHAARSQGAKVTGHLRNFPTAMGVDRLQLEAFDAVACITTAVLEEARSLGGRPRLVLTGHSIDDAFFAAGPPPPRARAELGVAEETTCLLLPAVFAPHKAQDLALEALARLPPDLHWQLLLVGPSAAYDRTGFAERLKRLTLELGLADKVRFAGHARDMRTLYAASDIVLVLSRGGEAFGRVAAEAGATGRPVIATAKGAMPEIVADQATGLLVDEDDVEGLRTALQRLIDDPALRRSLGEAGRERVRTRYRSVLEVTALERLFDDVLASPGRRR